MRRTVMTVCALALVVAACGGDDGTADPTSVSEEADSGTVAESGSDDDGDQGETDSSDSQPSDEGGSARGLPPGGTGTVTIDGETIDADWVGNCIIDETFDPHPDDLDLTAALGGGLNALFIEIYHEDLTDGPLTRFHPELQQRSESGDYASYEPTGEYLLAPDGNWYQDTEGGLYMALFTGQPHEVTPLDAAPMTLEGDRISGSVPLTSGSETVEVSFDLEFIQPVDCSL